MRIRDIAAKTMGALNSAGDLMMMRIMPWPRLVRAGRDTLRYTQRGNVLLINAMLSVGAVRLAPGLPIRPVEVSILAQTISSWPGDDNEKRQILTRVCRYYNRRWAKWVVCGDEPWMVNLPIVEGRVFKEGVSSWEALSGAHESSK